MRLAVHLQREIARLHFYDTSQSNRAVARATGLSPNTVASLREALRSKGLTRAQLEHLDDDAWRKALGTEDRSIAQRKLTPDWDWVHTEMQRPNATLEQLWQEWREGCPTGIGYTQFTDGYRKWTKRLHIVMRRVHRPGDKLFVDFAGHTVEIRDAQGGPSSFAQIFVAVLGYSNYCYLEGTASQTTADWVLCHVNCFQALGGVPEWVVSDNLKAAVWRRERDRIVINPTYRDALRHYDTAPLPTGSRKPKHKAKVEVGVQIAQRWVLFRLRDRVFFSLDELNAELRRLTPLMNDHPFKKLPGCRSERFENVERIALKPLPSQPFEVCDWRYAVRVGDDHHVEHAHCFYSVPAALAGERVDLRFTASALEIFRGGRRVALHAMLTTAGEASTVPEHRPVVHQRVLEGEPRALLTWAQGVGPQTARMIRHHLESRADATNGVKAARRMRDLARLYGDARFEAACAYALQRNITALRSMTSILAQAADQRAPSISPTNPRPVHKNLRGPHYFGETQ